MMILSIFQSTDGSLTVSEAEKAQLKSSIMDEVEIRVQQELAKPSRPSVVPDSFADMKKNEYERRVRDLVAEAGIHHPPTFIDEVYRKLGIAREVPPPRPIKPAPPPPAPAAPLPPCTILRPVAQPGDPPLPAIMIPGLDHAQAVKLLEDPNIQELLKKMAENHKQEMAKKLEEEGDEEDEEFVNESGEVEIRKKKKELPPPPMIVLQATPPAASSTSAATAATATTQSGDIVQQAIDNAFSQTPTRTGNAPTAVSMPPPPRPDYITIGRPPPRPVPRWAHEKFLESLPPIDSKFILDDEGKVSVVSTVDHDYGVVTRLYLLTPFCFI